MGKILLKLLFLLAGILGIVAIFFFSWFWRLLLVPIVLLIFWDVGASFLGFGRRKS